MDLPLKPPLAPMEALSVRALPEGDEWIYEPKWDGFRCIAFRDGEEVYLQSKAGRPLARYFPDVVDSLIEVKRKRFVVDGEIVIPEGDSLSFEQLQLRLHPAESRVRKLAGEHPALFIIFDLLMDERANSLLDKPMRERRRRLDGCAPALLVNDRLRLSTVTSKRDDAAEWLKSHGQAGGLDGVMAKRGDAAYRSGERDAMSKVKNIRTADCVVAGFRYASARAGGGAGESARGGAGGFVGSFLLGMYEGETLHHVGHTVGPSAAERRKLTPKLEALARKRTQEKGFTGRAPGGPSRWATERSGEWTPLPPELVAEVSYDHYTGGRFRHGARFLRWRPDKAPRQCTFNQLPRPGVNSLSLL